MILYKFQRAGVQFLVHARRAILADDMGLGKTAQAIGACEATKSERTLVICPNTLKDHWRAEIGKWAPDKCVSVLRGDYRKRKKTILEFVQGYLIINIESVRRPCRIHHEYALMDYLLGIQWNTIVVDEAHGIKNRKSSQTKSVYQLAVRAEHVYMLTGTPIMNRVDELWSPLHILYPKQYPSFWSFVRRHATVYEERIPVRLKNGRRTIKHVWTVDGEPIQPEELRQEITPAFLRREKEEVFPDMPGKVYQKIWLDMEGEQLRIYRDIEYTTMAQVNDGVTVMTPNILAQLTRCKQITVSAGLIGGKPDGIKLDALMDIVGGTGQKVLVFSQFAGAVKLVSGRLDKEGIGHVILIGETKERDRSDIINRFQTDPAIQVFLTTMQAGGYGITLTAAALVIFLDKHWTPAVNEQAVDRTRPHMQLRPVHIIELLVRDSVDEMVEDVLTGKVSIVEAVISRKKRFL